MKAFLTDERGDTSSGVAIGAVLVLLVVVLFLVMNGTFAQPQQPGIDINVRT